MIKEPCGLSGAFFLMSWLFINQFRHVTYQIKAEYHSYSVILIIWLPIKRSRIVVKITKILIHHHNFFERGYVNQYFI